MKFYLTFRVKHIWLLDGWKHPGYLEDLLEENRWIFGLDATLLATRFFESRAPISGSWDGLGKC